RRRRAWRAERREVETVAVPLGFVGWPADGARIAELRCLNGGDVPGIAGAHLGARDATPARLHEEYIRYNAPGQHQEGQELQRHPVRQHDHTPTRRLLCLGTMRVR